MMKVKVQAPSWLSHQIPTSVRRHHSSLSAVESVERQSPPKLVNHVPVAEDVTVPHQTSFSLDVTPDLLLEMCSPATKVAAGPGAGPAASVGLLGSRQSGGTVLASLLSLGGATPGAAVVLVDPFGLRDGSLGLCATALPARLDFRAELEDTRRFTFDGDL
jgi:hypothetical protein